MMETFGFGLLRNTWPGNAQSSISHRPQLDKRYSRLTWLFGMAALGPRDKQQRHQTPRLTDSTLLTRRDWRYVLKHSMKVVLPGPMGCTIDAAEAHAMPDVMNADWDNGGSALKSGFFALSRHQDVYCRVCEELGTLHNLRVFWCAGPPTLGHSCDDHVSS